MKIIFTGLLLLLPMLARADYYSPELAAKATAEFMNNSKTYKGIIENLSSALSAQEIQGIKELLSQMKIKIEDKLPVVRAEGNIVSFENSKLSIVFNKDRSFKIGDNVLRTHQAGSLDVFLKSVYAKIADTKTSKFDLLLPKTYAEDKNGFGWLLLGAGVASFVSGVPVGLAVLGVGTLIIYLGREIYETAKNNSISCAGATFVLRVKARKGSGLATSRDIFLDSDKVNQFFGKKMSCTPTTAKEFENKLIEVAKSDKEKPKSKAPSEDEAGKR
jgi:hypothetical protein